MSIKFSKSHEWVKMDGNIATVGISDYAQKELGDIVYVQLPEVGETLTIGGTLAEVESVKAASEVYSPVDGVVTEVNAELDDSPEKVNEDCYAAWLVKVDVTAVGELMDEADYLASLDK